MSPAPGGRTLGHAADKTALSDRWPPGGGDTHGDHHPSHGKSDAWWYLDGGVAGVPAQLSSWPSRRRTTSAGENRPGWDVPPSQPNPAPARTGAHPHFRKSGIFFESDMAFSESCSAPARRRLCCLSKRRNCPRFCLFLPVDGSTQLALLLTYRLRQFKKRRRLKDKNMRDIWLI